MKSKKIRNYSIGKKLGILEAVIVVLLMSAFTFFIVGFTSALIEKLTKADLARQVTSAKNIAEVYSNDVKASTEKLANVFLSNFPDKFAIAPDIKIKVGTIETPLLKHGTKPMNCNFDAIDRFSRLTGGVATIFVRQNDDFIRITTSLKKEDGSRAIGTALGKQHPGYDNLIKGEIYLGMATLFGKEYSTKYIPVKGASGETIGVLFIGYDMTEGVKFLKSKLKSIRIGETGYIYALNSQEGSGYGTLVIHPAQEGKNIIDSKDDNGNEFIKEILKKKEGIITYPWINKELGETKAREKMVAYANFDEWHMLFAAGAYSDELLKDAGKLRNYTIAASICIIIVLLILLTVAVNRMVSIPLGNAVKFARSVAAGDLTHSMKVTSNDETGELFNALNEMTSALKQMVGNISCSAGAVSSAAGQISANALQLTRAANSQASASEETSA
ncbi:MAG: methyl-accepting chemotaxis protein, partial [Geobacteraceae bacterium]|nr:methyl-accepting chemotaxis protein [Geobacteraceae bacterium]